MKTTTFTEWFSRTEDDVLHGSYQMVSKLVCLAGQYKNGERDGWWVMADIVENKVIKTLYTNNEPIETETIDAFSGRSHIRWLV
jgi:hypothetical protein